MADTHIPQKGTIHPLAVQCPAQMGPGVEGASAQDGVLGGRCRGGWGRDKQRFPYGWA